MFNILSLETTEDCRVHHCLAIDKGTEMIGIHQKPHFGLYNHQYLNILLSMTFNRIERNIQNKMNSTELLD